MDAEHRTKNGRSKTMTYHLGKSEEEKKEEQQRKMLWIYALVILVICAICIGSFASMCSGGGGGGGGTDLGDAKWDMYFECTARQKDAGYSVVEAGARCQTLRPE
jgi:hypothetical protein